MAFDDLLAAAFLGAGVVPGDPQLLASPDRRPGRVRVHSHAARHRLDVDDAGHRARRARVDCCHTRSKAGSVCHHGDEHPRILEVHREHGPSRRLGFAVEPVHGAVPTDQPERRRILEHDLVRSGR
jgi:hypothetical protein